MSNKTYTVKKGDSLWKIATEHNVSVSEIRKANPKYANTDLIHAGDVLVIPLPKVSDSSEAIRKQFATAMRDVQNLASVKKLMLMLEG